MKQTSIITYTGSFKYMAAIFLGNEKQISLGGNHPSTSNCDSLPLPQGRVVTFSVLKWPERMIQQ